MTTLEVLQKLRDDLSDILAERDMPPFPVSAEKAGVCYTDYLTGAHDHVFAKDPETGKNYVFTPKRNRQCSIGFHHECTDPDGKRCGCPCHPILKALDKAIQSEAARSREDDRRRKPVNRWGCKPCEDVCLEHDDQLVCRHGCERAKGHECSDSRDTTIIKDPPADAVVDLFDALKSVMKKSKQPASKAGPNG